LYNFVLFYHYCYHHYVVNKDFQFNSMQWGVGRAFLCPAPHVITRHTLWQGTKFSVFFLCRLQISRRRWHRSAWNFAWCIEISAGQVFSACGAMPPRDSQVRNFGPKFWTFDREYLKNGESERYMSIRA